VESLHHDDAACPLVVQAGMELLVKVGIDLGMVRLRIGILSAIGKITISGNIVTLGKSDCPFADQPMSLLLLLCARPLSLAK